MRFGSLRDLDLAGVKWELTENPLLGKAPIQRPVDDTPGTAPAAVAPLTAPVTKSAIIPPTAPIARASAGQVADAVSNKDELSAAIANFQHPLRQFAKNTVLPDWAESGCSVLIATDMPSSDDDQTGCILTGAAGELMDKMLSAIGLTRNQVAIVPLVFWRTPGGRSPTREELDLARPFVMRTISLSQPGVILTLGTLAAAEMSDINLAKNHGIMGSGPYDIPVIPIYHPNYLMLKPAAKRDAWDALQKLQNLLKTAK